jgi:type IV secretory pathway TrbL component
VLSWIDDITAAFLDALQAGATALAVYALPLLIVLATISYYREYSAYILQGGERLGDALASFLLLILGTGLYMYLVVHLPDLTTAALGTVLTWGTAGSGSGLGADLLRRPSVIFESGLKVAYPIAEFDTWFNSVKSAVKLTAHPTDLIAYWLILLAFLAATVHHMMALIEFHLSVGAASVLIPWGVWRTTSSVAEFAFGWTLGALIRILASIIVVSLAVPLFPILTQPAEGLVTLPQSFALMAGSFVFAVLCWVVPARAASLAGRGLALSGATLAASAMSIYRVGLAFQGVTQGAIRGVSAMLGRS